MIGFDNDSTTGHDIFIIAEIGINHNGDLKLAKELMKMAKDSGCDAVKFQKELLILFTPKNF
jgi:N-acetylneuraminate synthase